MYINPILGKIFPQQKEKNPLDEINNLIANKELRIYDAGYTPPEPDDNKSTLLKILDILDRPGNAVRNAIEDKFITGENSFLQGLAEGFTGKERTYGSDILSSLGVENKAAKALGGFAIDVIADPFFWLGGLGGAKALAPALRSGGMNKAAQLANDGVIRTLVSPLFKGVGEGLSIAGLPQGAGYAPFEAANGLLSSLGRKAGEAIGSIPVGRGVNLGAVKNAVDDVLGQLFQTRHVSSAYNPRGLTAVDGRPLESYQQGKALLQEGVNMLADTQHKILQASREAVERLKDTPLPKVGADISQGVIDYFDAPIKHFRQIMKEQKALPANARKYNQAVATKAYRWWRRPLQYRDDFEKEYTALMEQLRAPAGSLNVNKEKVAKKIADMEKAKELIAEVDRRVAKELAEIAQANPERYNEIMKVVNIIKERNDIIAKTEGLTRAQMLPNYIYHMVEGTPEHVKAFYTRHPELDRIMNPNIKSHKTRKAPTVYDLQKIADRYKKNNIDSILNKMQELGKITDDEIASLRIENLRGISSEEVASRLESVKQLAKERGVDLRGVALDPEVNVVKDVFQLQMARELDSARHVVRKELFNNLEELGLIKHSGAYDELVKELDETAMVKITKEGIEEANDLLNRYGWVKSDSIPGLPKGYAIHPEIARAAKRLDTLLTSDQELHGLLRTWQQLQGMWKSSVTALRPGWYITNLFGNMFNNYLAGLTNPMMYSYAAKLQSGRNIDDVLRSMNIKHIVNGVEFDMTSDQLMKLFRENGLEGFGEMYGDITRTVKDIAKEATGEVSKVGKVLGVGRKLGDAMETNAKLALFIDQLSKGLSPYDAAQVVKKHLFDYTDLTKAERKLKIVVPFYTFTRKNLPLQLKTLIERPDKYLAVSRAQQESFAMAGMSEEDVDNMPKWLRSRAFGTPWENKLATPLLPTDSLEDVTNPVQMAMNMLTPFLKTPIELVQNQSWFTGQPIERYEGQTANMFGMKVPAKVAYAAGQFGAVRELNRALEEYMTGKEYKGTTGTLFSPDNTALSGLLGVITSSIGRSYNPELSELYSRYDYDRKLEDFIKLLKDQGIDVRTVTEIRKQNDIGNLVKSLLSMRR